MPKPAVGAIIGREGCNVNGIRHASGASVQVLKTDDDAVETSVEIRGTAVQSSMVCSLMYSYIPFLMKVFERSRVANGNGSKVPCHKFTKVAFNIYATNIRFPKRIPRYRSTMFGNARSA